jgi:hypothetical protein
MLHRLQSKGKAGMNAPRQVPQAVIDALMRGDKMAAIKLLRELTDGDLKSAMQMVQQIAAQLQAARGDHSGPHQIEETKGQRENRERTEAFMHGQRPPTVMPGDGAQKQVVWVIVIIVAAVVWWLFEASR